MPEKGRLLCCAGALGLAMPFLEEELARRSGGAGSEVLMA